MALNRQYSASPVKSSADNLTVVQIAKKFGLQSTFETLEGHEQLSEPEMM